MLLPFPLTLGCPFASGSTFPFLSSGYTQPSRVQSVSGFSEARLWGLNEIISEKWARWWGPSEH